jgi:hypothetical protein
MIIGFEQKAQVDDTIARIEKAAKIQKVTSRA